MSGSLSATSASSSVRLFKRESTFVYKRERELATVCVAVFCAVSPRTLSVSYREASEPSRAAPKKVLARWDA